MLELFLFIHLKVCIYLATLGLSCGTPDLHLCCSIWVF